MKPYYQDEYVTLYHGDCLEVIPALGEKFDAVVTDPPYVYLKGTDFDTPFDMAAFTLVIIQSMASNAMLAIFGRGYPFYKLNCQLAEAGLKFKEEVVWDKRNGTSPCMPLSRVHETCAVFARGKGRIRPARVPYLEMKEYDLDSVMNDVKRIGSALNNQMDLQALRDFISDNKRKFEGEYHRSRISQHRVGEGNRVINTANSIVNGMKEKTIIRTEGKPDQSNTAYAHTLQGYLPQRCRAVKTLQAVQFGMREKDIIIEKRDHYGVVHPTQKPMRLFERLLAIVSDPGSLVLDPFAGSGTTGLAAKLLNRKCTLIEREEKYCEIAARRLSQGVLPLYETAGKESE